jgi:hypothetical protein
MLRVGTAAAVATIVVEPAHARPRLSDLSSRPAPFRPQLLEIWQRSQGRRRKHNYQRDVGVLRSRLCQRVLWRRPTRVTSMQRPRPEVILFILEDHR